MARSYYLFITSGVMAKPVVAGPFHSPTDALYTARQVEAAVVGRYHVEIISDVVQAHLGDTDDVTPEWLGRLL